MEAVFPFLRRFAVELFLLTVAAAVAVASFSLNRTANADATLPQGTAAGHNSKPAAITVDVAGAVVRPGVYELSGGSRLRDAVSIAGGLSETADTAFYQRNYNQARFVADQEKIYIPSGEEVAEGIFAERKQNTDYLTPQSVSPALSLPQDSGLVSINSAEAAELENLPGIGPATAVKIIQMRPYGAPEELVSKKAVKGSVFEQIKSLITL